MILRRRRGAVKVFSCETRTTKEMLVHPGPVSDYSSLLRDQTKGHKECTICTVTTHQIGEKESISFDRRLNQPKKGEKAFPCNH
jgi:hypothetical protein